MAYDEYLGERIAKIFRDKKQLVEELKMMGGLCFMLNGKMCIGIVKDELMARVGADMYSQVLLKPGCKEMTYTGRSMKDFVFVEADAYDLDDDLEYWVQLCIDFNPFAKASKRNKKKS